MQVTSLRLAVMICTTLVSTHTLDQLYYQLSQLR